MVKGTIKFRPKEAEKGWKNDSEWNHDQPWTIYWLV